MEGIIEAITANVREATVKLVFLEARIREFQEQLDRKKMVTISEGEFLMGSEVGAPHEQPVHMAYLDHYWIDLYEVTNRDYKRFVDATGYPDPEYWREGTYPLGKPDHPVVMVSWDDAKAYARWTGKRLPTEAEWEKAARGTDGRIYPWGDEFEQHRTHCGRNVCDTMPVGSYPDGASVYGLYDVAGNVGEWVEDTYDEHAYERSPRKNPINVETGIYRVVRGGVFNDFPSGVRSTARFPVLRTSRLMNVGFRCAKDAR